MSKPDISEYAIIMRKGQPKRVSKQILLWRRRNRKKRRAELLTKRCIELCANIMGYEDLEKRLKETIPNRHTISLWEFCKRGRIKAIKRYLKEKYLTRMHAN